MSEVHVADQQEAYHVHVIMDGSGRWAQRRGLPRSAGHRQGYQALKKILPKVRGLGVTHLTCFALSAANLRRDPAEVAGLFDLLEQGVQEFTEEVAQNKSDFQFHASGEWRSWLSPKLVFALEELERKTVNSKGLVFTLLLAYNGKEEWQAANRMLVHAARAHANLPAEVLVGDSHYSKFLWTGHLPEVDLVIRTGARQNKHLSAYALWFQMNDPLLEFPSVFWPDFDADLFEKIVIEARAKERRHGL